MTATEAETRPPVVLQVLPALVTGGVERGTVDVAQALAAAGWRAIVVSHDGPMVHDLVRAGATHIEMDVHRKDPLSIHANARRLARLIEAEHVDIVHARSRAPAWSAWRAARRTRRPFVTTFHGNYSAESAIKRWYNRVMTKGDRVIAISSFIHDQVVARYGIDPSRVVTIPRGIDLRAFDARNVSAERVIKLARAWRLPDGAPVVMLPGRLTRWKGQLVLVEAMARIVRRDAVCVLVGDDQGRTEYREALERSIVAQGLGARVSLVGNCTDMPAAYMLADVVVSASVEAEAFGRVAVEAQAMGRPVIATDHGGSRETILGGETGWLVPPGDAAALAGALDQALALSTNDRVRLALVARAHVEANFTRERMCAETLAVYESLLPAASAP
ncbi:MAG: glycosyltransferase family 4 protein [Alphaproteobacteria bacterium]|nr:glycosyltransferase family 4 protein [Alphaproteobacteria bacterium]